jgi:hypothetical protein
MLSLLSYISEDNKKNFKKCKKYWNFYFYNQDKNRSTNLRKIFFFISKIIIRFIQKNKIKN